ncbi:MAG: hypothetical protein ACTSVW_00795 [Candidatus Njordarchaeales archaeon]
MGETTTTDYNLEIREYEIEKFPVPYYIIYLPKNTSLKEYSKRKAYEYLTLFIISIFSLGIFIYLGLNISSGKLMVYLLLIYAGVVVYISIIYLQYRIHQQASLLNPEENEERCSIIVLKRPTEDTNNIMKFLLTENHNKVLLFWRLKGFYRFYIVGILFILGIFTVNTIILLGLNLFEMIWFNIGVFLLFLAWYIFSEDFL